MFCWEFSFTQNTSFSLLNAHFGRKKHILGDKNSVFLGEKSFLAPKKKTVLVYLAQGIFNSAVSFNLIFIFRLYFSSFKSHRNKLYQLLDGEKPKTRQKTLISRVSGFVWVAYMTYPCIIQSVTMQNMVAILCGMTRGLR